MAEADAPQQYLGLIDVGDFLLDLRPRDKRSGFAAAAAFLKFQEDVDVCTFEFDAFSLALSSVDEAALWGSFDADDLFAAVVGRIDLEESAWQSAESVGGNGGLAAKFLALQYREKGATALEGFSGNFALLLWDKKKKLLFVATDICGALPIFESTAGGKMAWASHPDSLALCVEESGNLDSDSMTEFLLTSMVMPPNTFYKKIRSLTPGTLVRIDLNGPLPAATSKVYYSLDYRGNDAVTEEALADELAEGFIAAVNRRTLPRLGPVAVALSGGLDSRTILAAARDRSNIFAFCCFDSENFEFAIARSVANALGVKLTPLTRDFEYYGDNAEMGIKIAGGMGTFANNHFLGVARPLRELGAQNFLTGCYCDYMFKALPLNTVSGGVLGKQSLAPYSDEFYFMHYRMNVPAAKVVRDRFEWRFPKKLRTSQSPEDVFEVEKRRTFPLFQEGDNEQRMIPQRVLHSYLPVADRQILETYRKIPYRFKLDRSLFKKVVTRVCGEKVSRIPDANTGAPVSAGLLRESIGLAKLRLGRKIQKLKPGIACATSWPDWAYYVPNSKTLKALWDRPCPAADEFFRKTLSAGDIRANPGDYTGDDRFFFVQMLTLKIWLSQRS